MFHEHRLLVSVCALVAALAGCGTTPATQYDTSRQVDTAQNDMGSGSVGFQIGVEVSEVVIFVMTDKALNALLSKSYRLGADASMATGPVGIGTASTVMADMVSFARSKGLYAGLSFDGAVLAPDTAANSAFYGRPASPADILVRANMNSPAAAPLQQFLFQIAK